MLDLDADHIAALCRGFMTSRLMLTAAELDLFTALSGRWLSAAELAAPDGWDEGALRVVLDALVVSGLLEKRAETYSATELCSAYLSRESPESVLDQALEGARLWERWSHLTERVVGHGRAPSRDPLRAALGASDQLAPRLAPGIAALVRPETAHRFLDVGGGSGAYTIAFLARDRSLEATLLDRPEVLAICAEYLRAAELEDQVVLVPGDLTCDEFPGDQGMVLLSAVIHLLSLDQVEDLCRRAYRALLPGGRVIIRDFVMSPDRLIPRAGAIFAANLLVSTEHGTTYSFPEIRRSLALAGFVDIRILQDGERMNTVIEAHRPPT
ncbi:MAG: methyltransferase [Polyangiaceae bacterium]